MRDVEVDVVELVGVGADGLHERHRPVDLVRHRLVALPRGRRRDEVGVPGVDLAQVGVPAGDEGPDHAQRRRRGAVHLQEPARVGHARLGGELEAVDRVATVRRQRHAGPGLEVGGARLGVLPGEPAQLHHGHRRGVGQHDRHLQQDPQLVAGVVGGDAGERLGAVTALEQERLALGDRGELGGQLVALAGVDQGPEPAQLRDGGVDGVAVGIVRLLGGPERVEARQVGKRHVPRLRGTVPPVGRASPFGRLPASSGWRPGTASSGRRQASSASQGSDRAVPRAAPG